MSATPTQEDCGGMWESLPPVVPLRTAAIDDLTGVAVVAQRLGMLGDHVANRCNESSGKPPPLLRMTGVLPESPCHSVEGVPSLWGPMGAPPPADDQAEGKVELHNSSSGEDLNWMAPPRKVVGNVCAKAEMRRGAQRASPLPCTIAGSVSLSPPAAGSQLTPDLPSASDAERSSYPHSVSLRKETRLEAEPGRSGSSQTPVTPPLRAGAASGESRSTTSAAAEAISDASGGHVQLSGPPSMSTAPPRCFLPSSVPDRPFTTTTSAGAPLLLPNSPTRSLSVTSAIDAASHLHLGFHRGRSSSAAAPLPASSLAGGAVPHRLSNSRRPLFARYAPPLGFSGEAGHVGGSRASAHTSEVGARGISKAEDSHPKAHQQTSSQILKLSTSSAASHSARAVRGGGGAVVALGPPCSSFQLPSQSPTAAPSLLYSPPLASPALSGLQGECGGRGGEEGIATPHFCVDGAGGGGGSRPGDDDDYAFPQSRVNLCQSFYAGTTGNENLQRSFLFPHMLSDCVYGGADEATASTLMTVELGGDATPFEAFGANGGPPRRSLGETLAYIPARDAPHFTNTAKTVSFLATGTSFVDNSACPIFSDSPESRAVQSPALPFSLAGPQLSSESGATTTTATTSPVTQYLPNSSACPQSVKSTREEAPCPSRLLQHVHTSGKWARQGGGLSPFLGSLQLPTDDAASVPTATEASRRTTVTNASFFSPTVASLQSRRLYEDSTGLLDKALTPQVSGTQASWGSARSLHSIPGPRERTSPQLSPPPPPPPPPRAPAHVLEWEQNLIAFQQRAESYYAFKNTCTDVYLTSIEHGVDRFLVCYYSGGAMQPAEAVREAFASRLGDRAGASPHLFANSHSFLQRAATVYKNGGLARSSSLSSPPKHLQGDKGGLQRIVQTRKVLQRWGEKGSKWLTKVGSTLRGSTPTSTSTQWPPGSESPIASTVPGRARDGDAGGGRDGDGAALERPSSPLPSSEAPPSLRAGAGKDGDSPTNLENGGVDAGEGPMALGGGNGGGGAVVETMRLPSNSAQGATPTSAGSYQASCWSAREAGGSRPLTQPSATTRAETGLQDAASTLNEATAAATASAYLPSAEEMEMQQLQQLGGFVANVIPEDFMNERPSDDVLQQTHRNHAILLHALHHVLRDSDVTRELEGPEDPGEQRETLPSLSATSLGNAPAAGAVVVTQMAEALVTRRLREGLLVPAIEATWQEHLSPLRGKVKELISIAQVNIEPILRDLQLHSVADGALSNPAAGRETSCRTRQSCVDALGEYGGVGDGAAPPTPLRALSEAESQARAALRASRGNAVARLIHLLHGDEEYLAMIQIMDSEFIENGPAWRERTRQMRMSGVKLSDYVPVYGLVLSRLHRLEMEHRTLLELWDRP